MSDLFELNGPALPPQGGGPADSLVVLLHGYGADGDDLIGLAPHLAAGLPKTLFVSPNAPFPCEMGFGRQWFSFQNRTPAEIKEGLIAASDILNGFLDGLLQRFSLKDARMALVGFSQGTMMALDVAPRRVAAVAGVVGFSGRLIDSDALAKECKVRPPVLLVHGDADTLVPIGNLAHAEAGLKQAGMAVETLLRPGLAHSIDEAGITAAAAFLQRVLA